MFLVLPYLAVVLFGLALVVRLVEYRKRDRRFAEEATAADRSVVWIASQALLGGVFGFLLITATSMAVLLGVYQQEIGRPFAGLESLLVALILAVTVVPTVTMVGLRALGITPAPLATLGAWGLCGVGLSAGRDVGDGGVESALIHGLIAAVAYALATAGTVAIPSMVGRPGPTDRYVSPPPGP